MTFTWCILCIVSINFDASIFTADQKQGLVVGVDVLERRDARLGLDLVHVVCIVFVDVDHCNATPQMRVPNADLKSQLKNVSGNFW